MRASEAVIQQKELMDAAAPQAAAAKGLTQKHQGAEARKVAQPQKSDELREQRQMFIAKEQVAIHDAANQIVWRRTSHEETSVRHDRVAEQRRQS